MAMELALGWSMFIYTNECVRVCVMYLCLFICRAAEIEIAIEILYFVYAPVFISLICYSDLYRIY